MRNAGCTGNAFRILAGGRGPEGKARIDVQQLGIEMSKLSLIISLMTVVGIMILGIAIYLFTHLSGISATQGFILLGVAVVGLILVMGIILMFVKSVNTKK